MKYKKIIDTGVYRIVRHPMYAVTIVLFLTMPLILGSVISFLIFWLSTVLITQRIKNKEIVLERDLKGYSDYKKNVNIK